MKSKQTVSSQFLILALAALVIVFMIQAAKAETAKLAQNNLGQSQLGLNTAGQGQVLQIRMPQRSLFRRILDSTTLTYYHQFSGPTLSGNTDQTYNVFQEGVDQPRSGQAPIQSFHAANLRFQLTEDWAVGASVAAANGYTGEVETRTGGRNSPETEWFNARAYLVLPAARFSAGTFYTTISYEAPTSNISKNDEMKWGWVFTENFAFNLPNKKWTAGIMGQYWRAYYGHERNVKPPPFPRGLPTQLQTVIISGGPYATYRFNDKWGMGSVITFDWDQRGVKTDSQEFNNNLPHRGRLNLSYYPALKYVSNVGLFATGPLQFRPETTAIGADFGLKF